MSTNVEVCGGGGGAVAAARVLLSDEVRAQGPARLSRALAPHMPAGSRIVYVSSELGRLKALNDAYRGYVTAAQTLEDLLRTPFTPKKPRTLAAAYSISKVRALRPPSSWRLPCRESCAAAENAQACIIKETQLLAAELAPRGVLVNAVSPGWCRTSMGSWFAFRSAAKGANSMLVTALATDGATGLFFKDGKLISHA